MAHFAEFNDDPNTPTEDDLESCYGSRYLSSTNVGKKKIRTRILKITKETMQQQGGKPERAKFVLYLSNIDKPMVLNATNKNALVDALGRKPADWINAEIGLYTEMTSFGGKSLPGLRLQVLSKPKTVTASKPVEEGPPADEEGDPGPEFSDDDLEAAHREAFGA